MLHLLGGNHISHMQSQEDTMKKIIKRTMEAKILFPPALQSIHHHPSAFYIF